MTIRVGEVIAVSGVKITLKIDDDSSKEALFFKGDKFKGVSIREYVCIQRGFRDIVCVIEGEYLDESRIESEGLKTHYIRKVEARPIGFFEEDLFRHGIKYMPMIRDPAHLMSEVKIAHIFDRGQKGGAFVVGRMLKEEISISLPWQKLFNSHIGIFGNTGSGKSNTLAKLFTVLFDEKAEAIGQKSKFVIIDFNGEYTGAQIAGPALKQVYHLSTRVDSGDRFPLHEAEFWNLETLSLLFQATANTQRPFLNRLIQGRAQFQNNIHSLSAYAKKKFREAFCAADPKPATLDLMRAVADLLGNAPLLAQLRAVSWWGGQTNRFVLPPNIFINADGTNYDQHLAQSVDSIDASALDHFDQLILRANLQLIADLTRGYVQFDHIQPLLKRIESSLGSLRKVLVVGGDAEQQRLLTVVSLRRCNNETKKVLPLLLAKHYYNEHRTSIGNPPNKTVHLIVDEAHNILSQQSVREHESWKDYRLEQFEEIVKEGRKFGVFITISSQRPADVSPTIVSQLHNFLIHRLVNDRDLFLIDNTITTLDALSRGMIPNLAQGCCVVTGTAFDLPIVLQIDRLEHAKQPDSEDVDLESLWSDPGVGSAEG